MAKGVATHGPWCNAHTYPTRCRYCGDPVFYFQCSCGSKVFFDDLGIPWPEHNCLQYKYAVYGKEMVEEALTFGMMLPGYTTRGQKVERAYSEQVQRQREADKQHAREIIRMDPPPYDQIHEDIACVAEIISTVDIFKRARTDPNHPIAVALLGPLGKGPMSQVTFLIDDLSENDRESYTCYISRRELERAGLIRGDIVDFRIRSMDLPLLGPIWYCEEVSSPFR